MVSVVGVVIVVVVVVVVVVVIVVVVALHSLIEPCSKSYTRAIHTYTRAYPILVVLDFGLSRLFSDDEILL